MEKMFLNKSLDLVVLTGIFASSIILMHLKKKEKILQDLHCEQMGKVSPALRLLWKTAP